MANRFKRWLSIAIIAVALPLASQVSLAQSRATSPEEVVKQFYRWYLNAGYPEPADQKLKFRRYVTQRCLKEAIAAEDYVYFTQAQDADPAWKNHIAVASAKVEARRASTEVILSGKAFSNKLKIELVQENGAWKINRVKSEND